MKINFNAIANAISIASGVTLAGVIGVGSYVYVNREAIIEDVKEKAIEEVMKNVGGGALGGVSGALTGDVGTSVPALPSTPEFKF
tara:strand:+ start:9792 stop:10046 length:255 start_codon:yes stop_codon:yes gene_type:complete